jgi:signal transduction histidine kinase
MKLGMLPRKSNSVRIDLNSIARCFGSIYGASRSAGAARRLARAVDASGSGPGGLATLRHDLRTPLSAIKGLARPARAAAQMAGNLTRFPMCLTKLALVQ